MNTVIIMKTSLMCMECNIKQVVKVSKFLGVDPLLQEQVSQKVFQHLSSVTFDDFNPLVMGKTFDIIKQVYESEDPYFDIKKDFNDLILSLYPSLKQRVTESKNPLDEALKLALLGNVIDFGARHTFTKESLIKQIEHASKIHFTINHSEMLFDQLRHAKTLFYIGDNAGEIIFDKLFIETIKEFFPNVNVTFGVRGGPILNDVTMKEATYVKMDEVTHILSSGVAYPGTVVTKCNQDFQQAFLESDVVISKGQGNFEGLSDEQRPHLYFLLLAKCTYVADTLGVDVMDYIVKESGKRL
jgi:uncharacterized protein with ATP-grasp and redox domains